jgi:O-antigen/teichoic acid export membrane protein
MNNVDKQSVEINLIYDELKRSSSARASKILIFSVSILPLLMILLDVFNSHGETLELSSSTIYVFVLSLIVIVGDRQRKINKAIVAELERIKKMQGIQ